MAKKRFSESQIYRILLENQSGSPIPELIKKYGISQATIYNWKARFRSMNATEIIRINELQKENERLKKMYADLSLDNLILKEKLDKLSK